METARGWAVWLVVALAGCGPPLPLPVTASDLRAHWSGPALVEYLGQPDASAAVCATPAAAAGWLSQDVRTSLMFGLTSGVVAPALWRACTDQLMRSADEPSAVLLLDAIVAEYTHAIADSQVEQDPRKQARVESLQSVYLGRPAGRASHPNVIDALETKVATARAKGYLGPWAARHALAFVDSVDIERGWFRGHAVEVATLDWLFGDGEEALLRDCSQRLPTPALRAEARRRVIRLRINASSNPDVRAHAAAIEDTVMRLGVNPVALDAHPPLRARLDLPVRQVRVRQNVWTSTASLLAATESPQGVSLLPELPLRGALQVDVNGLAKPITVCAPAAALDPEPCLAADALAIASPLVTIDHDGVIRFSDHLAAAEILRLARDADSVVLLVSVGGRRLAAVQWELSFERPADLILQGASRGPDLQLSIAPGAGGRVIDTVWKGTESWVAVTEAADAARFRVVSQGPDGRSGMDGSDGSDGTSGMSGSSASCPSSGGTDGSPGGNGSNGGDGSSGEPGGDGGAVRVEIVCGRAPCPELVALAKRTITSAGGSGGEGGKAGRGGHGGPGGSGGSGTTCSAATGFTSLSGGHDGASGSDGSYGSAGARGFDGAPGPVTIVVVP